MGATFFSPFYHLKVPQPSRTRGHIAVREANTLPCAVASACCGNHTARRHRQRAITRSLRLMAIAKRLHSTLSPVGTAHALATYLNTQPLTHTQPHPVY